MIDAKFKEVKAKLLNGKQYILIVGDSSLSIFEYLGVNKWSGLSVVEGKEYKETKYDAYINAWTNELPKNHPSREWSKYFLFLNKKRLEDKYLSQVHESVHLARCLMNYAEIDDNNEEEYAQTVEQSYRSVVSYFDSENDKKFKFKLK